MIIPLLTACTLLASYFTNPAELAEPALLEVHYALTHVIDSTRPDAPVKSEMMLLIGKNSTVFTDFSELKTAAAVEEWKKQHPEATLGGRTVNYGAPVSIFKNLKTDTFTSLAIVQGNSYTIEEPALPINWAIGSQTKNIQGYNCQLASAVIGGRKYEAWFSSELPFSSGPWKMSGLPGLILEATDSKKQVSFQLISVSDNPGAQIVLSSDAQRTTASALRKAAAAYRQNAMQPPAEGQRIGQGGNFSPVNRRTYNNPIELNR